MLALGFPESILAASGSGSSIRQEMNHNIGKQLLDINSNKAILKHMEQVLEACSGELRPESVGPGWRER